MSPERNTKSSEQINRSREDELDVAIPDISSVVFIILKLCFISSKRLGNACFECLCASLLTEKGLKLPRTSLSFSFSRSSQLETHYTERENPIHSKMCFLPLMQEFWMQLFSLQNEEI